MNSRERLQCVLNHRRPDRVPMDFGAGGQTGIMASTVYKLKQYYGLLEPGERIKVIEPYQMLGEVDDKLRDHLGIDAVGVGPLYNMFGCRNEDYKEFTLFDGTPVWVPGHFNTEADGSGNIPMYPQGDESCPPSAVMPSGGYYFDAVPRKVVTDDSGLDCRDNCEEFVPLSDEELSHFGKVVAGARENYPDKGLYLTFPGAAFGDIGLVPATFLKDPRGIRDISDWYMSLALRPDYIKKVFEYQCENALANLKRLFEAVGNEIDVIFMSGTDFGTQSAPMMSEATYRELFLPYQKCLNDWVHENTTWKTFMHSCGAIEPLLEAIIEAGFDVLNPVQCSATGMDPEMLVDKYGDRLVFWGGGVDTQNTLPFGTPEQVFDEVSQRVNTMKRANGYVFNAIHNVQANIPPENFDAAIKAYKKASE
ncbi:MAG: uroporphyrinogen decarboxylase family protein [Sedimentisphaeraceae bacterium JB056]